MLDEDARMNVKNLLKMIDNSNMTTDEKLHFKQELRQEHYRVLREQLVAGKLNNMRLVENSIIEVDMKKFQAMVQRSSMTDTEKLQFNIEFYQESVKILENQLKEWNKNENRKRGENQHIGMGEQRHEQVSLQIKGEPGSSMDAASSSPTSGHIADSVDNKDDDFIEILFYGIPGDNGAQRQVVPPKKRRRRARNGISGEPVGLPNAYEQTAPPNHSEIVPPSEQPTGSAPLSLDEQNVVTPINIFYDAAPFNFRNADPLDLPASRLLTHDQRAMMNEQNEQHQSQKVPRPTSFSRVQHAHTFQQNVNYNPDGRSNSNHVVPGPPAEDSGSTGNSFHDPNKWAWKKKMLQQYNDDQTTLANPTFRAPFTGEAVTIQGNIPPPYSTQQTDMGFSTLLASSATITESQMNESQRISTQQMCPAVSQVTSSACSSSRSAAVPVGIDPISTTTLKQYSTQSRKRKLSNRRELVLYLAIVNNQEETLKNLIMSGCPVDAEYGGMTPVATAFKTKKTGCLRLLLEAGANCEEIRSIAKKGSTAYQEIEDFFNRIFYHINCRVTQWKGLLQTHLLSGNDLRPGTRTLVIPEEWLSKHLFLSVFVLGDNPKGVVKYIKVNGEKAVEDVDKPDVFLVSRFLARNQVEILFDSMLNFGQIVGIQINESTGK